jgi:hypothetical protein
MFEVSELYAHSELRQLKGSCSEVCCCDAKISLMRELAMWWTDKAGYGSGIGLVVIKDTHMGSRIVATTSDLDFGYRRESSGLIYYISVHSFSSW